MAGAYGTQGDRHQARGCADPAAVLPFRPTVTARLLLNDALLDRQLDDLELVLRHVTESIVDDLAACSTLLDVAADLAASPLQARDLDAARQITRELAERLRGIRQALRPPNPGAIGPVPCADLIAAAVDRANHGRRPGRNTLPLRGALDARVEVDPDHAASGLARLLENAWDASDDPPRIELRCRASWVEIAIQDTGPGIPADAIDRALRPFHSEFRRRTGGRHLGLGLPIAYRCASCYRGGLMLSALPGGGMEAALLLPPAQA